MQQIMKNIKGKFELSTLWHKISTDIIQFNQHSTIKQ